MPARCARWSGRTASDPDVDGRARSVRLAHDVAARLESPLPRSPHDPADWAWAQPSRSAFVSNASGVFEIYSWDRDSGATEQITDRAAGTHRGAIDPTGEWIWWFDDADGNEFGSWRRTPFRGGASQEAVVGLPPSYSSGLCLGLDGLSVVGCSTDDGAAVYATRRGGTPVLLYAHPQDASVSALSRDGELVAIEHSEHGDSRHVALRVLRIADGSAVADLWDGPGLGLSAVAFAPVAGDTRLIAAHERLGRWMPFIWDVAKGAEQPLHLDLPGDVSAQWFADASALLVPHDYEARSSLFRLRPRDRVARAPRHSAGTILGTTARPNGVVEFMWSSGAEPPVVRDSTGPRRHPPTRSDRRSNRSGRRRLGRRRGRSDPRADLEACRPHNAASDAVHGARRPDRHDTDTFSPGSAAWVDSGFVVVRVNYRGSTGYGTRVARRDRTSRRTHRTRRSRGRARLGGAVRPFGPVAHRARRRLVGWLPHAARCWTRPRRLVSRCRGSAGGRLRRGLRRRDGRCCAHSTAHCSAAPPTRFPIAIGSRHRSPTWTT